MISSSRRTALLLIAGFAFLMGGGSVQANIHMKFAPILLANNAVSLAQAVEKVRRKTGGRILSATKKNNGSTYVIKVLMPDGQVRTFRVDAATGTSR